MSFVALLVFIATILLSFDAIGAVKKLNIEQLTEQSTQIVNGHVVNLQSYWQKGKIFTDVTIRVSSYMLGAGPVEIVIPVPGGTVGKIAEVVSDVPHFELGQEVILFLRDEYFEVVGWYQGKFTVEDEVVVETGQEKSSFIEDIVAIESRLTAPPEKGQLDALIEAAYEVFDPTLYHKVEPALSTDEKSSVGDEAEEGVEGEPNPAWSTIMSESFDIVDFPYSPWDVYAASGYTDAYWDDVSTGQDSDTKVNSGAWSCYCADEGGSFVWPPGPYPADMRTWMVYGPFSLADASDAELLFYVWSKTESDYDYFKYLASINGTDFFGYEVSGDMATSCGGFCYMNFDLANVPTLGNLCGQSEVWIAFLFTSDSDFQYEGTYLDDLILREDVSTVPAPVINSINPTSGPAHAAELGSSNCASDSTLVTVNGSNFGATQGTSYVRFWRVGSTYINGCVTSWSDTQIKVRVPGRASSGNILVHTDTGGDSNTEYYTVTYSYGGGKWPGPSPMKDTNWTDQQYYYVNPNTTDTTGELAAVQASANSWNYVGNADFNFRYGGTTTTAAVDFYDYKNVIFWNPNNTGSIATNYSWWYTADKNTLIQFDTEFNDYSYTWATDGSTGKMDVQSVATHELGHSLTLLDLYGTADSEKTMYGYASTGETKQRTLHTDDIAGIHYIYPSTGTAAVFRVTSTGDVLADGSFYGSSFQTGAADVAEWVLVSEPVEPGDVLELDPENPGHYRKPRGPYSDLVAGVVSTDPGFILGSRPATEGSRLPTPDRALLALIGIVPMKVTNEGGPIQPGDLLVTSSTPGYAMRWDPGNGSACSLAGKALEPLTEEHGIIFVLLTAH